jgi:hypothetical protein
MPTLEIFAAAVIAGLGFLLAAVGAAAYRRSRMPRMLTTAVGFACAGAGGAGYAAVALLEGPASGNAVLVLLAGVALSLVLFYLALFARSR